MKKISILGSTGSIGTQSLDIIRNNSGFKVVALSTNTSIDLLEKQALEFKPEIVSVGKKEDATALGEKLKPYGIKVSYGIEGLIEVASENDADILINSVVGMIGLRPTLKAIEAGKTIALANKETLVTGGEIVMNALKKNQVSMIPVDSEHSAIFQCLQSGKKDEVEKLILTASGGPFRGMSKEDIKKVTLQDALKHPNWNMGRKITIDSATLMNKGLEVIEAKWLFDVDVSDIDVVVHPQSIIHSMVEFVDGSVIAQLGEPDMRVPIQYALTYPSRAKNHIKKLNLLESNNLTFEAPDRDVFPCLNLAMKAIDIGGTMPTVLNASNEIAVEYFLNEAIKFTDIPEVVEQSMNLHRNIINPNLDDILNSDKETRENVIKILEKRGN